MFKKYKSILILFFSTFLFSIFINSCTNQRETIEDAIVLSDSSLIMDVYEVAHLEAITKNEKEITWTSSDEEIVKVENGQLSAFKVGEVTIVASISKNQYSECHVQVVSNNFVPFLKVEENSVNLFVDNDYQILPTVTFKSKQVEARYEYRIDDSSIASVDEDGTIHAHSFGCCDLTIVAQYGAFTGDEFSFLKKTIELNVSEVVILSIESNSLQLTCQERTIDGILYENEAILSGTLYDGNKERNIFEANVTFYSSDESIVKIKNDKIVAQSLGKAYVYAEYSTTHATYTSNKLQIEVIKPYVIQSDFCFDIDLSERIFDIDLSSFAISSIEKIEKIYDIENKNKNLYNGQLVEDYDELGLRKWVIETQDILYEVNVICCSRIIQTATDMRRLHMYAKNVAKGPSGMVSFEGYYILKNDIDMEGSSFIKNVSYDFGANSVDNSGFIGTFDGRGYTIYNVAVTADNAGLFGTLNKASIIKNVAFINASVTGRSGLLTSYCGGTIANCYVDGSITGKAGLASSPKSLLASIILPSSNIYNCIINYNNSGDDIEFAGAIGKLVNAKEANFEHVFVLNTTQKVFVTTLNNEYDIFTTSNNGQFINYESLKQNQDLSSFNKYWSFDDDKINFLPCLI